MAQLQNLRPEGNAFIQVTFNEQGVVYPIVNAVFPFDVEREDMAFIPQIIEFLNQV